MEPRNPTYVPDDNVDTNRQCPQCGEYSVTTYWHHDAFKYGSGDAAPVLQVDLPVRRCEPCDYEFLDYEGERLRHEAVCRHLGLLCPAEISDLRKRLARTRAEFAEVTGLGEATLNRWENGAVVQNVANDRYLRLLALPGVMQSLRGLIAQPRTSVEPNSQDLRKFRVLTVSDGHLRRKERFELRLAS